MKFRIGACFVAAVVCAIAAHATAGSREDVLEAMGRCAAIADNAARLKCYDAVAPQLRTALATPPATLDHPPTKTEQESWFGFNIGDLFGGGSNATTPDQFGRERTEQAQAQREQLEIDSITEAVSEVSYTADGKFIVFLKNGQVWRQLQGDADHARFKTPAQANQVTISHGGLGSYNLTMNGSAKLYKVTRVK